MKSFLSLLTLAFFLLGCALPKGTPFTTKYLTYKNVGNITKEEFIEIVGKPKSDFIITINKDASDKDLPTSIIVNCLKYFYQDDNAKATKQGVVPTRFATVEFSNNKLIFYNYQSSFLSDSTDFNPDLISKIQKGKTTREEVIQFFGPPSGAGIYPFAKENGGSTLYYNFNYSILNRQDWSEKLMRVYIDPKGIVTDIYLYSSASNK